MTPAQRIGMLVLAALPLVAVRPLSRALATPFAARAADRLGSLATLVPAPGERRSEPAPDPSAVFAALADENERPGPAAGSRPRKKPHHVHVPRAAVVRALAHGANPTARIVEASDDHPGGIAILAVGALKGILYPGDVVTDVAGVPATSEQAVLAVVARAQQSGAKVVSGHLWRRGEHLSATAETPWSCSGCTAENWQRP